MVEKVRLPPIPDELTSAATDPTTKIIQTPDGRVTVHSTRSGTEGKIEFQADGSFKYHSNTGSIVEFASNNHLFYQKGGFTLTVDNNGDIKIAGHGRINFDQDAHIEVAKNASIAVNGLAEVYSTGHVKMVAADIYLGTTMGSVVINSARDIELTANKGRLSAQTSGVQSFVTSSGDFHVATAGMVDLNSQLDTTVSSQGKITTTSQSDTTIDSKGAITSKSQGDNTVSSKGSVVTKSDGGTKLEGGGPPANPSTVTPVGGLSP